MLHRSFPNLQLDVCFVVAVGLPVGTYLMILSMRIACNLRGGIDFGRLEQALAKCIFLVMITQVVQIAAPHGFWLCLLAWFLGLLFLFRADLKTTSVLAVVNWWAGVVVAEFFLAFKRGA